MTPVRTPRGFIDVPPQLIANAETHLFGMSQAQLHTAWERAGRTLAAHDSLKAAALKAAASQALARLLTG